MTTIDLDRAATDLQRRRPLHRARRARRRDARRPRAQRCMTRPRATAPRGARCGSGSTTRRQTNQRVWNLPNRSPVFADLAEHPVALRAAEVGARVAGAARGTCRANITGPGGGEMVLHADQIFVPTPWPGEPQGANVRGASTTSRPTTGRRASSPAATCCTGCPSPRTTSTAVPMEAPAGSMVVFEGRLWHRTGNNRTTDQRRAGIFGWYTRPIYRPQENWFLRSTDGLAHRIRRPAGAARLQGRGARPGQRGLAG